MNKKTYLALILIIASAVGMLFLHKKENVKLPLDNSNASGVIQSEKLPDESVAQNFAGIQNANNFHAPLGRSDERITKKLFGIYVAPQNSPIQPERFRGYHTGTDFEIFPEELGADVDVKAICSGKLEMKKTANGYGGVAVQNCQLQGDPITVIYGHIKLASVSSVVGEDIIMGDKLGTLGDAFSSETGGERKHLHLGIHKGAGINILGYVTSKENLSEWMDTCLYVCE